MTNKTNDKSWRNGNQTRTWRIIVGVLLVLVIPAVTWGLLQIVDFPKVYVEKEVVKVLSQKIDEQYSQLLQKMDRQYERQMESIADINRYLRGIGR